MSKMMDIVRAWHIDITKVCTMITAISPPGPSGCENLGWLKNPSYRRQISLHSWVKVVSSG